MAKIFVSYNRKHQAAVLDLAKDLELVGHSVFIDQELSGGQRWWNALLDEIAACDLFIPALSQGFDASVPCLRETQWAVALGKPLIPVQLEEDVRPRLLMRELSESQWVDYREGGKESALRLMRAVSSTPPAPPLPAELPERPEVPIAYLDTLKASVESTETMTRDQQFHLLVELKGRLDGEEVEDVKYLLRRFRQRQDLLVSTANEIDALLVEADRATTPTSEQAVHPPPQSEPSQAWGSTGGAQAPSPPPYQAPPPSPGYQPAASQGGVPPMPPNYLVWAIVATLCSLIGIVAIIFAAQVETKYRAGDYAGSKNASDKAKLWVVISFVVSVFFLIIIIAAAASSSSSST